jgi:hypothetical protein
MKRYAVVTIVSIAAALCLGQKADKSDVVFDDTKIQKYNLSFYGLAGWADTLAAHKASDEDYIPARFIWYKPSGDSLVLDSIGVRYKGNSSYNFAGSNPKKPYKFCFNWIRKNQKFNDLEKLNFSNLVNDPSCMREKISYDLCRRFMPVSRADYAIISVDSQEIGLYLQLEEVDKGFLTRNYKDDRSNLYKSSDNGATLKYQGPNQSSYAPEYDLRTNKDDDDWSGLILMLNRLNNTPDPNFVAVAGKILDLDNCIRYTAYNEVTSNFDSYTGSGRNIYLYDDHTSMQFKLIPWDFNLGMGNFTGGWNVITVDAFQIPNLDIRPLSNRIMSIDTLKKAYGRYIAYMIDSAICPDTFAALAERIRPVIDSAVKNDPNNFYDYEKFLANIEGDYTYNEGAKRTTIPGIKSFPKARFAQLKAQLEQYNIAVLNPTARTHAATGGLRISATPGSGSVVIRYSVQSKAGRVSIKMHNARGELVRSTIEESKNAGPCSKAFDTRSLPSGFYTVSIEYGKVAGAASLMLLKE